MGPEIFDLPRFVLNELEYVQEDDVAHIELVIEELCKQLGYPKEDVRKLFYMETVLANIWHMEDGQAVNDDHMRIAQAIMRA